MVFIAAQFLFLEARLPGFTDNSAEIAFLHPLFHRTAGSVITVGYLASNADNAFLF